MRRILSSALAVAALVTLAGCSSDDKEEASTSTTVAVATTTAGGPATSSPTYTGDKNSAFCQVGRANNERLENIGSSVSDPEQLNTLLREAAPAVREAASLAPPEIKADVTILADGFEQLLDSLESGEPDISLVLDPRFQEAAQHLSDYGRDVCGITE